MFGVFTEQQGGLCVLLGTVAAIQVSYRGSDQGDICEDGERWSDSGYILNIESIEFPNGLLVGVKRKKGVKVA